VGITAGASASEHLVHQLVEYFRALGTTEVEEVEVAEERVSFVLPPEIIQARARRQ
jgi:4-hydroxy-3-methylbut-2-enyl diphosphate reductase